MILGPKIQLMLKRPAFLLFPLAPCQCQGSGAKAPGPVPRSGVWEDPGKC